MEQIFIYREDNAVVATTKGKVKGYTYRGIHIFKGIPYARSRRFHAPEPVEAWDGVLDATSYGYVCPLLEMERPTGELLVPHRYWVMDEDCQNLNIWTPGCDGEKRPVIVWLHGGGYRAGSAIEQLAYEGENMCREGQVVVVSINHRLNILGYCDLSDFGEEYANSGNAGTDDIIAALQWIKENIEAFGGDAGNVTLVGQSGGGAKITTLLQTPAADGLYARGINMSGVIGPVLADSTGSGRELGLALMQELGAKEVKELETVPYHRLAEAYKKLLPVLEKEGHYVGGTPHPNAFYLGEPCENGFRRETAQVPLIVGTVFGEFTSFVAPPFDKHRMTREEGSRALESLLGREAAAELLPLFQEAYPERNPVDILMLDYIFRLPTQQYIKERSKQNQCTYSYLFNYDLPVDGGRTPWHCADIPYVFHNTELVAVTQEPGVTHMLEKQIFDSVMAFARTGNPNHEALPFWPVCEPEAEYTMLFGREPEVKCNFDKKLVSRVAEHMQRLHAKTGVSGMGNIQH